MVCVCTYYRLINTHKTETLAPEADTRLWVKEAFTKKDIMQMPTLFNHERAVIIQTRLQAETDPIKKMNLTGEYAMELLSCGKYSESISMLDTIYKFFADYNATMDPVTKRNLYSLVGIAYMRQGEIENCLQHHNHESCLIPIQPKGIHQLTTGSRKAIEIYEKCLAEFPHDLETIYLLNLAYMTLGEYPNRVPKKYLIDPSWFKSKIDFPRYPGIAAQLGVNRFSNAGGTVIDDFNNDGWLDIVVSSLAPTEELVLYLNNGDGTFSDRTEEFGLKGHVAILNFNQTDYNNDGWLDLFLMRGGWYNSQGDMPCTLLKNTGKGSFVDVTMKAGLTKYAASQTSAWADYNLDGWLDLIKANESLPDLERGVDVYINQKDGTFRHESTAYGLTTSLYYKGCVATDANNDRYPDIFFSPLGAPNLLFINQVPLEKRIHASRTWNDSLSPRQELSLLEF
ncbi:MAG: VCBS repeat-containing protein [Saprospiraceae bacterium]|nr:VCBS repeat-containing protein [Candidatus Opimibacter skivensis]